MRAIQLSLICCGLILAESGCKKGEDNKPSVSSSATARQDANSKRGIITIPLLLSQPDQFDESRVSVSGFIGGDGGSSALLSFSTELLKVKAARHECVTLFGEEISQLAEKLSSDYWGQYVYVTGRLDVRRGEEGVHISLSLTDITEVQFAKLTD